MPTPKFPDDRMAEAARLAAAAAGRDGECEPRHAPVADTHGARLFVTPDLRVFSVRLRAGGALVVTRRAVHNGAVTVSAPGRTTPRQVRLTDLYRCAFGEPHPSLSRRKEARARARLRRERSEWGDSLRASGAHLLSAIRAEIADGLYTATDLATASLIDRAQLSRVLHGPSEATPKTLLRLAGARSLLARSLASPPSAPMGPAEFEALRVGSGYTQRDLADRWGVTTRTVRRLETEPGWLDRQPAYADALRYLVSLPQPGPLTRPSNGRLRPAPMPPQENQPVINRLDQLVPGGLKCPVCGGRHFGVQRCTLGGVGPGPKANPSRVSLQVQVECNTCSHTVRSSSSVTG